MLCFDPPLHILHGIFYCTVICRHFIKAVKRLRPCASDLSMVLGLDAKLLWRPALFWCSESFCRRTVHFKSEHSLTFQRAFNGLWSRLLKSPVFPRHQWLSWSVFAASKDAREESNPQSINAPFGASWSWTLIQSGMRRPAKQTMLETGTNCVPPPPLSLL